MSNAEQGFLPCVFLTNGGNLASIPPSSNRPINKSLYEECQFSPEGLMNLSIEAYVRAPSLCVGSGAQRERERERERERGQAPLGEF